MRLIAIASAIGAVAAAKSKTESPFPQLLDIMRDWATGVLAEYKGPLPSASEYPYFNFMPMYQASAIPGADASWSAPCFANNVASFKWTSDTAAVMTIESSGQTSEGCQDDYMLTTVADLQIFSVTGSESTVNWSFPADLREAESWDISTKGIRVHRFITPLHESAMNVLETIKLFVPEFTQQVDPISAQRNVDFMAKYPQIVMSERDPLSNPPPPEHMVHSGDFFGIIRLDGLDPMLAWAMGSSTGHTTIALWIDGELFICESTVTDSYWPTDGIQKTPYKTWLKQAAAAGYNAVWVPLNKKARAMFDEQKALEFFNSVEGLEYGYKTMLWSWIDTLTENYPCVPPDYSSVCLQWQLVETLFGVIDRNIPDISAMLYNDAWNKRVGTVGLPTAEIYKAGNEKGISTPEIPAIVEQDSWVYNTTRYGEPAVGRSMVCCVLVCSMWKAAGVFGDLDFNCQEVTNWDDYSLDIFENEYQQILGRYTLELNDFHTKAPYPHMAETCASLAPDYEKDPKC